MTTDDHPPQNHEQIRRWARQRATDMRTLCRADLAEFTGEQQIVYLETLALAMNTLSKWVHQWLYPLGGED